MPFITNDATVEKSLTTNNQVDSVNITTSSSNGTLTLTATSITVQVVQGTATGFSVVLPDATTLTVGRRFIITNSSSAPISVKYNSGTVIEELNPSNTLNVLFRSISTTDGTISYSIENSGPGSAFVFVTKKSDLPAPSGGVINLVAGTTYFLTKTIDLTGDRLVAGNNTTILGGSSENCGLISTGLSSSTALLSSTFSLPLRNLYITHGTALNLDATGNSTAAIDWFGVNFVNCATVGTIKTYSNVIWSDCALLSSANLTFDGTIGTVGFNTCIFSGIAAQTIMIFPSTLTITRRIRIIYSSFVAISGGTAINVNTSAVIPSESYILDSVNFSGGATYVAGVQHTDDKAFFKNNKNIENTAELGQMYYNGNATENTIATQGVFEKILGTTTANANNTKFSHTSNRLTYTAGITREFVITANASAQSVTTQTATIAIRIAKNGTTIAESESRATTSQNARNENFFCQALVELATNDFVELFIANNTSALNLLVTDLNFLIRAVE
jgi:hypothetical protein